MSVEFDPVPLGRPRRRTRPVVIVVIAILFGLALAVLKPWDRLPSDSEAVAVASASAVASPDVASTAGPSAAPVTSMATPPPVTTALTWTNVARAHFPVRSFSVDVVSVDWSASTGSVGYPVYAEGRHAPSPEGPTVLDTGGRSIVALGVDPADGSVVRDVRIYRVRADGGLEWVDANPVGGAEAGGPLALAIPDAAIAFPAGRYRVDALVDGAIRRVDVAIPGLDGTVPAPGDPGEPDGTGLVPLSSSDPSEVLAGPFVTVDGRAVPLDVAPVDPLDETGAWIDGLTTPDSADRPTVARVYQPRATGIGVMLTSHARIERAEIVRLAPDVPLGPVTTIGGVSYNHGGTPWIGFAAPGAGAWPAGDYAMTVFWVDGTEHRTDTWHVELRPGPSTPSAPAPG